ncbi:hypothetical protein DUNSADRAFT_1465 [Dunaliella salina]|uniref:Transmembrane protein n=1 Tax=Dunaliella salina TaxID=3046 RepID=A0ABQ7GX20_DUNSA|nr:hypothetical protein DUNSADRAFT_1465 [Dunaliella salina]|eukprot:KAF5839152.1 hypothetical protein DUNSADRAFT_1465 [Dunaliella salina]
MGKWRMECCLLVLGGGTAVLLAWRFGPSGLAQALATNTAVDHCAEQCEAGPGSSVSADHACMPGGPLGSSTKLLECAVRRVLLHRMLLSMLWLCITLCVAWFATKLLHWIWQHCDASKRVPVPDAGVHQEREQRQQEYINGSALGSNSTSAEGVQQQHVNSSMIGACSNTGMGGLCWAVLTGCFTTWTTSRCGRWLEERCGRVLSSRALPGILAVIIGACHALLGLFSGIQWLFLVIGVCAVSGITYWLASGHTARCVRAIANEAAVRLVALHRQNEELADEKEELEAELRAVAQNPQPALHTGSPADLILEVLDLMLQGGSPHADDLLVLRDFILSGGRQQDMYQPLDVWQHLHLPGMEPDVEAALFQQLGFATSPRRTPNEPSGWTARDGVHSLNSRLHIDRRKSGSSSSDALTPDDACNSEGRPDANCVPGGGPSSDSYLMSMLATLAYDSSSLDQAEGHAPSASVH